MLSKPSKANVTLLDPVFILPKKSNHQSLYLLPQGTHLSTQLRVFIRRDTRRNHRAWHSRSPSQRRFTRHIHIRNILVFRQQRQMQQDSQWGGIRCQNSVKINTNQPNQPFEKDPKKVGFPQLTPTLQSPCSVFLLPRWPPFLAAGSAWLVARSRGFLALGLRRQWARLERSFVSKRYIGGNGGYRRQTCGLCLFCHFDMKRE